MELTGILIIIVTAVVSLLFAIKARLKNDISLYGGVLARLFLIFAFYLYYVDKADLIVIHLGVLLAAFSDLVLNVLYIISRKYYKEIEHNKLVKAFADLQQKYFTVVENAQIGIYMMDQNYKFEFINSKMEEILECNKLHVYTKTPFDFIIPEQHARLKENLDKLTNDEGYTTKSEYTIKTCSGKFKKILVVSNKTVNGHITITGSALLLE